VGSSLHDFVLDDLVFKHYLLCKPTHDATRLAFLGMSFNINSMSLNMMREVTSILPVHCQNIPTLLLRFSLVVVKEEAFGFHWTRRVAFDFQ